MERILKDNETWEDAAKRLQAENKILHTALGSHEGPEGPPETPYEERELMTLDLMKLWVVRMEPAMGGPKFLATKALERNSIRLVDWNSGGLLLLPPMKDEKHVTAAFDIIKREMELSKTYRVEYFWPYGVKG